MFETISIVSIVLFIVGLALLLVEMFIPGFGIFGGLGLIALVLCVVFQAGSLVEALILVLILAVIVAALSLLAARSFRRGWLYRSPLVLKNAAGKEQGYVANEDYSRFAGRSGQSLTPLRPAGTAVLGGEKADVITDGEFIPAGAHIVVVRVAGARIVVKQTDDPA